MKNKSIYFPIFLLTSIILTSCGGDGDVNFNIPPVSSFPPVSNPNFEAEDPFSREVAIGNQTSFNLTGKNGKITITGMLGANSILLTGVKRVRSDSTQDAEEHLQELEVNVQSLANEVRVETIQPQDTGSRRFEVDYTITLPKFLKIQLANGNGSVTLDSIENDVTVNNVNGSVTLREIVGSALVNLTNGTIEGETTLPLNGTLDLNTVNGNINLAIPVNTSAEFSAAVSIGSISVSNLVLQNEVRTSTTRSGTLGSGQGTIALKTGNGNITMSGL